MYFLLLLFADCFGGGTQCAPLRWMTCRQLFNFACFARTMRASPEHRFRTYKRSKESVVGRLLTLHLGDKYCRFHLTQRCYDTFMTNSFKLSFNCIGLCARLSSHNKSYPKRILNIDLFGLTRRSAPIIFSRQYWIYCIKFMMHQVILMAIEVETMCVRSSNDELELTLNAFFCSRFPSSLQTHTHTRRTFPSSSDLLEACVAQHVNSNVWKHFPSHHK